MEDAYWQSEHNIKDHLGNIRLTFADKNLDGYIQVFDNDPVYGDAKVPPPGYTEILQENHYYPFGMNMDGPWRVPQGADGENFYQYNGKELNEDIGLGWHDYGARWYDAAIGRWGAVDPLADLIPNHSTYAYVFNDPISFNDPTGMMGEETSQITSYHVDTEGNFIGYIDDGDDNIYVHAVGTTYHDVVEGQERTGSTSGGGDNILGEGGNARELRRHSLEQHIAGLYLEGELTQEEYLLRFYALQEDYWEMAWMETVKHKWDLASYIPYAAWLKWVRGAKLFKHGYKYSPRVRKRALEDPLSHNFPYSFDDAILATKPILKKNGYKIFQKNGTMNGKNGVFEIGLTKDGVIDHRFFRPSK